MLFVAFIYWIWRARNLKIFEGKSISAESLIHTIKANVRIKLAAMNYSTEEGFVKELMESRWGVTISVRRKKRKMVSWSKPPAGFMKLNIDGSLRNGRSSWDL